MRYLTLCLAAWLWISPVSAQETTSAQEKTVPASQSQLQLSFAPLVKQTAPAVVNIFTKRVEKLSPSPLLQDPVFRMFFGNVDLPKERVTRSLGSGVIVRADGYVVTNLHVIDGSDQIRVVLSDRREFDAKPVVTDKKTDLALLKMDSGAEKLPFLAIRNSDDIEVGDLVLAIGNPFGIGQTVTSGIISAVARTAVGISDYQFFIQTDAAINPGNSGGALITTDGKLIGINTAIYSKTGGSNGIGFATPSNTVRAIIDSIENKGKIVRPWFGAGIQPVTADIAQSLGLPRPTGVLIRRIVPKSPVELAGIQVGDVILRIEGHEISDVQTLRYRVATYSPGTEVPVTLLRSGQQRTVTMRMEAPSFDPPPDYRLFVGAQPLAGATAANLSPALAMELDLDAANTGVAIVDTEAGSIASRLGVEPGDVIEAVNREQVRSTDQLEKKMRGKRTSWQIIVRRDGQRLTLNVQG